MGHYHNKLDKKYFHKSIYEKKFEDTFKINIKKQPLQYDIIFDTYNTMISFNNVLFSRNYTPTKDKISNSIHLISSYLNKYKSKINKCYDLECIRLYGVLENILFDLEEMLQPNVKPNLKHIEKDIEECLYVYEQLNFDMLLDSKIMPFQKLPNDKLPKKVNCRLVNNLEQHKSLIYDYDKQKQYNEDFIKEYYNKTSIDLNKDKKTRELIFQ